MVMTQAADPHRIDVRELRGRLEGQGVRFLLASFVGMSGVSKAKLVPITHLEDVAQDGAGFAGFAVGGMGQGPHSPDLMAIPDLGSLLVLPWRRDVAWAAGNLHVEGDQWPYCPRGILKRQIARAAALGYTFKIGIEPEFFLVRRGADGKVGLGRWPRYPRRSRATISEP